MKRQKKNIKLPRQKRNKMRFKKDNSTKYLAVCIIPFGLPVVPDDQKTAKVLSTSNFSSTPFLTTPLVVIDCNVFLRNLTALI